MIVRVNGADTEATGTRLKGSPVTAVVPKPGQLAVGPMLMS